MIGKEMWPSNCRSDLEFIPEESVPSCHLLNDAAVISSCFVFTHTLLSVFRIRRLPFIPNNLLISEQNYDWEMLTPSTVDEFELTSLYKHPNNFLLLFCLLSPPSYCLVHMCNWEKRKRCTSQKTLSQHKWTFLLDRLARQWLPYPRYTVHRLIVARGWMIIILVLPQIEWIDLLHNSIRLPIVK